MKEILVEYYGYDYIRGYCTIIGTLLDIARLPSGLKVFSIQGYSQRRSIGLNEIKRFILPNGKVLAITHSFK